MNPLTRRAFIHASAAIVSAPLFSRVALAEHTKLVVGYSDHPEMYDELARQFTGGHPGTEVSYLPAAPSYDDLLQVALRDALVQQRHDIDFQGFGQIDTMIERNVAQSLDGFVEVDPTWSGSGLADASMELVRVKGQTYGIPFALATPLIYVNMDLVARAGLIGDLPSDWEGLIGLAKRVNALGQPISGGWFQYGGNWLFPALLNSRGAHLMDADGTVGFDNAAGLYALQTLRGFGEAGMIDLSPAQARQAFAAGTIGMLVGSSSWISGLEKQIGQRFRMSLAAFPCDKGGTLPAGGNAVVMLSSSKDQQAAWSYMRFVTGSIGQAIMLAYSGYVPPKERGGSLSPDLVAFFAKHPNQAFAYSQVDKLGRWEQFPGENSAKLNTFVDERLQAVSTLKQTPEAALAQLARDVMALLPHA